MMTWMIDRYMFRGRKAYGNEWVIGYFSYDKIAERGYITSYENCYRDPKKQIPDVVEVDVSTVGQCTEIKDKNGTIIFEDDVIVMKCAGTLTGRVVGKVRYSAKHRGYVAELKNHSKMYIDKDYHPEIIGNIHDDPKLLNTKFAEAIK